MHVVTSELHAVLSCQGIQNVNYTGAAYSSTLPTNRWNGSPYDGIREGGFFSLHEKNRKRHDKLPITVPSARTALMPMRDMPAHCKFMPFLTLCNRAANRYYTSNSR